jgi:riboflavin synthase
MFTGIIKGKGTISCMRKQGGDVRMSIQSAELPWQDYEIGESISVNGVCLTAVALRADGFDADVSTETLQVTALSRIGEGSKVNLEPAMAVGDRLGGHIVSGHVDCMGTILSMDRDARSTRVVIEIPAEYARYVARKGSVCVDGVSLTINAVSGNTFDLNIIPHTADFTLFGEYEAGTVVNIEVDLLARYLERLMQKGDDGISMDFLKAHGYAE